MDKQDKKALLRAWREKQKKTYILNKRDATSLFRHLHKCLEKAPCDHTLQNARAWLAKKYAEDAGKQAAVVAEWQEEGGMCDCEVLLNCYERYELE